VIATLRWARRTLLHLLIGKIHRRTAVCILVQLATLPFFSPQDEGPSDRAFENYRPTRWLDGNFAPGHSERDVNFSSRQILPSSFILSSRPWKPSFSFSDYFLKLFPHDFVALSGSDLAPEQSQVSLPDEVMRRRLPPQDRSF